MYFNVKYGKSEIIFSITSMKVNEIIMWLDDTFKIFIINTCDLF